jgi:hypothetical protein
LIISPNIDAIYQLTRSDTPYDTLGTRSIRKLQESLNIKRFSSKERKMLPGSILPPGLQIASIDNRESACENEEEYAQKYGQVVNLRRTMHSKWLVSLIVVAVVILLVLSN